MTAVRDELRRRLATAEPHPPLDAGSDTEAAVLVPLYASSADGALHAVFTKRRDDLRRHAGEISFPGGRRDHSGEPLEQTALREAEEEIGLPPGAVELVGELPPVRTFVTGYVVYPYVGLIEPGHDWTPSPSEVAAIMELPLQALIEGFAIRPMTRRGFTFETDTYVVGEHLIWGVTARIVGELLERLGPPPHTAER